MIDLKIEPTRISPYIMVDSSKGIIELKGKSTPENAIQLYYPVIDKVKELFVDIKGKIQINISLQYFNTSSSKCIFDLLRTIKGMQSSERSVHVNWYYEEDDDDMLETGEDYEDILGLPFSYIPIEY